MNSWYDIVGLGDRDSEQCDGLNESMTIVKNILENENRNGVPYNRMMLAGFSQVLSARLCRYSLTFKRAELCRSRLGFN